LVTKREMKKHRLDPAFISSSRHSIQHADLIGVVHDVSNAWTRNSLSPVILDLLQHYSKIPSFLILNKIDLLKSKRVLLDVIKLLTDDTLGLKRKKTKNIEADKPDAASEDGPAKVLVGWPHFEDVFMVSSLSGDGLNKVMVRRMSTGMINIIIFCYIRTLCNPIPVQASGNIPPINRPTENQKKSSYKVCRRDCSTICHKKSHIS
jgi:hypothetical protein